ncbi:Histone-lysine N-methyltransferase SETMAR [Eumeta japonica]|uniref:Histone-lysine N-methyltransferase SETMAR n=1 Tax=Eumeta variegata TaxID=151549 RepID=A0A4C1UB79_EUMVA|nr:Histone-lysine N-methyltransferase SETMAR [Eumeta japonica]
MDLKRENFRAMIYYDFRRGITQKQCIDQLTLNFRDETPSKIIVYHWFSEFNRGRSILMNEFKEGRPKSDPKTKQQLTVWVFQDEPNPTKVIHAKSTLKQMLPIFFGRNGHLVTVPLENRKTVNSEWCMTICFPEVFEEIRKDNRQCRIILHHDNASCHTSAETTRFLEGQKIKLMGHPPYSPDLASKDFYLFPSVKNKLSGQRLSRRKKAVNAFKMHIWCTMHLYRNGRSAIKIGFSVFKSASIIMANILKNNRTILNDGCLFLSDVLDT